MRAAEQDARHMARALELARRALFMTRPNPRVGCVLVRDGETVGEGWTAPAGGPHAEIRALQMAGKRARGATAYVNLEPCSHHGRTPPCVDALIEAGVARVVAAMRDPNPQVGGAGLARLRAAGVDVAVGPLEEVATALNAGFVRRMARGRPLVRLKLAASLDGRTAMASGESRWITGFEARRDVQRLRARSCAVITGSGTVLADDPRLTVRPETLGDELDGQTRAFLERCPPLRVVVDGSLRTPPGARLFAGGGEVLIAAAQADPARSERLVSAGATVRSLPTAEGRVDLAALLATLAEGECNEVLVEAGAGLAGAFLAARLVDELWLYQAPMLLGAAARPLISLELERLAEAVRLETVDVRAVGADQRLILKPVPRS